MINERMIMGNNDFRELERNYKNACTNRALGAYVSIVGVVGLIINSIWEVLSSPVALGILVGGGIVFYVMCSDRVNKLLRKLDCECYSKFGKSYKQSQMEIFYENYPK